MGRVALVTGGTRGIGAAIAEALQKKGYQVIVTYQNNVAVAKAFHKRTNIQIKQWDVSQFVACQEGVQEITAQWGDIDILVNNAGITRDGFLHKMTPDMWGDVIATNLTSCFNMTNAIIGGMRERGFGRIISISSINGVKGQIGQTNYAAAKAGVIGFTKALALENATKGITVNAIAPGYIDTDMMRTIPTDVLQKIIEQVPAKRLGLTAEVAHAVTFLADDEASYITGATLHLNGGQYLS
jgi:acetoacetyl-CoA reductase